MNSWKDIEARRRAVAAFVKHVAANPEDRVRVTRDRNYAKELFARLGEFEIGSSGPDATKIPARMEFRVYDRENTQARDEDLGIIVLPDMIQGEVDVDEVWRCTWPDWTS